MSGTRTCRSLKMILDTNTVLVLILVTVLELGLQYLDDVDVRMNGGDSRMLCLWISAGLSG